MEQPLLPLKPTVPDHISRPYVSKYTEKLIPKPLFVTQASISVTKDNILKGYGSDFCDSQHDATP